MPTEVTIQLTDQELELVRAGGLHQAGLWQKLVAALPQPIKPGDRVRRRVARGHDEYYPDYRTVLSVHGNSAWVLHDSGSYGTNALSDLERLP